MITEVRPMPVNEIKRMAKDSWALIIDPVYSEKDGRLKSGQLLFFHKDKKTVHQFVMKKGSDMFQHYTIFFTGELPKDQIFVL